MTFAEVDYYKISRVRLDGNQLSGNTTEDFGVYPNLTFIDISFNKFNGEISSNWVRCPNLGTLRIARNNLTGSIPPEISKATQLGVLDLSSNRLVGEIPKELGKLTRISKFNLSNNQLSGAIPQEFESLTNLEQLDMSRNNLGQSIQFLGNCIKLNYLNLSNNKFNQEIPSQLENLLQLSKLVIPFSEERYHYMRGLEYIDISYNDLQSPIPDSPAFKSASIKVLQGNKASYNYSSHEDPALGLRITRIASVLRFPSLCLRILIVIFSVSSETPSNKGIPIRTVRVSRSRELSEM
ncbi:hypothetical protein JRO89_XS04G0049200 [Xanthoceras sorbifolium]|uniref:Uncharacterized protein n=1 Tax=Xanthoceras sorbifolium TaxID=99658 RepID=A0ABQ8I466_9ROSI|nr:hypothetical protein JRO89_XS04G0049200 [Xanthoceras sorbifolium]